MTSKLGVLPSRARRAFRAQHRNVITSSGGESAAFTADEFTKDRLCLVDANGNYKADGGARTADRDRVKVNAQPWAVWQDAGS